MLEYEERERERVKPPKHKNCISRNGNEYKTNIKYKKAICIPLVNRCYPFHRHADVWNWSIFLFISLNTNWFFLSTFERKQLNLRRLPLAGDVGAAYNKSSSDFARKEFSPSRQIPETDNFFSAYSLSLRTLFFPLIIQWLCVSTLWHRECVMFSSSTLSLICMFHIFYFTLFTCF